nr:hypothetical protein GCM10020185_04470 [Pseudomonas brassicacearum subsp. brassicacearum]
MLVSIQPDDTVDGRTDECIARHPAGQDMVVDVFLGQRVTDPSLIEGAPGQECPVRQSQGHLALLIQAEAF